MSTDSGHEFADTASGRLPTCAEERLFASYGSLLYTLTTLAAAIWIILVGGVLPSVGDTRLAILGYACGMVFGTVPVLLSSAVPSFRSGADSIDVSKATLGVRGSVIVLVGMLLVTLGWAAVALSMVARGLALLVARSEHPAGAVDERLVIAIGFAAILTMLILLRRGLETVRKLNNLAGPGFVVLALVSFALLAWQVGLTKLWFTHVPAAQALTTDRLKSFAYAMEFGVTMAVAWWPFMGGLYRLVKYRRHIVGPAMIGGSLIGNAFSASVAALATVHFGSADPAVWLIALAGAVAGPAIVFVTLLLSIPAIAMVVYFAAIAAQQVRVLARLPWVGLVVLTLIPLAVAVLNSAWTLAHIVALATWGSLMFFAVSGVMTVDFWILRRQSIAPEQLFVSGHRGHYWFWGGVNWVAVVVMAVGVAGYLALYDPMTLRAGTAFRYLGAALPVIVGSGALYYLLARLIVIPSGRGGYREPEARASAATTIEVGF